MKTIVQKSRNPIVQAAFAGLRKEQRAEKKVQKEEAEPLKAAPAKKSTRRKPK